MKLVLVTVMAILSGCVVTRPSFDEENEALKLIDEGSASLRVGDLDRADASFAVAYELTGSAVALDGLGCVAFLRNDLEEAGALFERALVVDGEYERALSNLALVRGAQGRDQEAIELLEIAKEINPRDARIRNNLASFLANSGEESLKERAITELLKASALVPHPLIENNIRVIKGNKYGAN